MNTYPCLVCNTNQRFMFDYQSYHYYRCPECSHVTTYPIPDQKTIIEHYKSKFASGNYRLLLESSHEYKQVYSDYVHVLDNQLSRRGLKLTGRKVLDVGCFTGEFLQVLEARGADVFGLELQSQAVEIANGKLPGRVFQADITSSDFPEIGFDVISLLATIEHLAEPLQALKRARDLLQTGGILLLQTPDSGSLLAHLLRRFWPPYVPVEHIHIFSRKSLTHALHSLGFKDIHFSRHRKKLPINYVYRMLENFGPEFHQLFAPFYNRLPTKVKSASFPFYVGEMIMTAHKI